MPSTHPGIDLPSPSCRSRTNWQPSANGNTLQVLQLELRKGRRVQPHPHVLSVCMVCYVFQLFTETKRRKATIPSFPTCFSTVITFLRLMFVRPIHIFIFLSCMYYAILSFQYLFVGFKCTMGVTILLGFVVVVAYFWFCSVTVSHVLELVRLLQMTLKIQLPSPPECRITDVVFFFFFQVLEIELRTSHMLDKHSSS